MVEYLCGQMNNNRFYGKRLRPNVVQLSFDCIKLLYLYVTDTGSQYVLLYNDIQYHIFTKHCNLKNYIPLKHLLWLHTLKLCVTDGQLTNI